MAFFALFALLLALVAADDSVMRRHQAINAAGDVDVNREHRGHMFQDLQLEEEQGQEIMLATEDVRSKQQLEAEQGQEVMMSAEQGEQVGEDTEEEQGQDIMLSAMMDADGQGEGQATEEEQGEEIMMSAEKGQATEEEQGQAQGQEQLEEEQGKYEEEQGQAQGQEQLEEEQGKYITMSYDAQDKENGDHEINPHPPAKSPLDQETELINEIHQQQNISKIAARRAQLASRKLAELELKEAEKLSHLGQLGQ